MVCNKLNEFGLGAEIARKSTLWVESFQQAMFSNEFDLATLCHQKLPLTVRQSTLEVLYGFFNTLLQWNFGLPAKCCLCQRNVWLTLFRII